ncbi:MAG TPA: 6-phosphogluconolactonase [Candidatus Hydrogenedentes bacterium]|jgi:6-phosphogluconolactonase|nr:6-phosphogluconolactonase [Candidatus Hydrogenedentota bacterium]HOR51129.1 6-phosphogluconolactonase [Candidatus Hydrogenedentota bacterium]HPK25072.1 6-phosphogluconolactonase [Candidatus Hydrogenedentota bacterium]
MMLTSVFDTRDALFQATARRMAVVSERCLSEPAAILIPGGNTPRALFELIAANPFPLCPGLRFAFTDERHVPLTDAQSNYGLAKPMLDALQLPDDKVMRVAVEEDLEQAAAEYDAQWHRFFGQGGTIPLILLGIGDDGHTCSLFTHEQLDDIPEGRYAVAVPKEPGPARISTTPALLARAAHVIFLVTGSAKAAVVQQMQEQSEAPVAVRAVAGCPRVSLWFTPED